MTASNQIDPTIPVPGVTQGPDWAENVSEALTELVEQENAEIKTADINLDADLEFNQVNATEVRSIAFRNSVTTLPISDQLCVYVADDELYYNDINGNPVQLTLNGGLNTGALALNVWSNTSTAVDLTIPSSAEYILVNVNTSAAPRTITLPLASGMNTGRFFIIDDVSNTAGTNNITITPQGSDTIDTVASSKNININSGSIVLVKTSNTNWKTIGQVNAATTSVAGIIKLAQDLGGTANLPIVLKINKTQILTAGGSFVAGQVLRTNGAATADWGQVNLANTNSVTGVLPVGNLPDATTTTKGIVQLTGGLGGTATAPRVTQLTGYAEDLVTEGQATTYTVLATDYVILVDLASANYTINLPALDTGRRIKIKNISATSTFSLTIHSPDSDNIEGGSADLILYSDFGSWELVAGNAGWWLC